MYNGRLRFISYEIHYLMYYMRTYAPSHYETYVTHMQIRDLFIANLGVLKISRVAQISQLILRGGVDRLKQILCALGPKVSRFYVLRSFKRACFLVSPLQYRIRLLIY